MRINLTSKIIESSRGRPKIAYEGYFYNHKEDLENKKIWRCNFRGCSSLLKTNLDVDLLEVGVHNHLKDDLKFNKVLLQQKIKSRSLDTKESSRNVVLGILKENKHLQIPLNIRKLNSLVNKTRKVNDYTVIKDYDIPCELQFTNENSKFLHFDSGMNDTDRVLIFTTTENMQHLENSSVLICDGTFKSSPTSFEQIFTIQCKLREMFLPMMFCFMKHRNEGSYNKIYAWIGSNYPNVLTNPKSIILDFELASINAIKKNFVASQVFGCNFHLGQIVWRKVQSLKFASELKSDTSIRRQVKMILALSFVEIDDMEYYATKLEEYIVQHKSSSVLTLFSWFKQEYLHNNCVNKTLEFWNVKKRTDYNIPRTTNSLEGYHRHLNTFIITKQNSIISILNELKNEQTITENKIFWSLYKDPVIKHDPVRNLLEKYSAYDAVDYLTHIALNFNWKLD